MNMATQRPPVPVVVLQHCEDGAVLANTRTGLVEAPHVKLHQLGRLDERLAAHLDGLFVAGEFGMHASEHAMARAGTGESFVAAALAIAHRDMERIDRLLAAAEAADALRTGVVLAFCWADAAQLRGLVAQLLDSPSSFRRQIGLTLCPAHLVDPGVVLERAIGAVEAPLRAQAYQAAGACGRTGLLADCLAGLGDADMACRFQAAQSSVRLGDRGAAVEALSALTQEEGPYRAPAFDLLFRLATFAQAAPFLKALLDSPDDLRMAIRGAGTLGDPQSVPWLIEQMGSPQLGRLAGESFSMITGLDLAALDLERKPPGDVAAGPDDDPENDDVAMDEDEGLPWPDPERIRTWWSGNAQDFSPGTRFFMGAPPSWSHCMQVLRSGFQRQRLAAAEHLCLLVPGTLLFPTNAPAWRQSQWLAQMVDA